MDGEYDYDEVEILGKMETYKLEEELKLRGQYYVHMTDEEIKEEAQSRGFFVSYHDEKVEILEDIYRHATWMTSDQLYDYLDNIFERYLNKWL